MEKKDNSKLGFALAPENYKFIIIGFAIIVLGFILMTGGKADNPNEFNPEVFSFRRITLAPLLVLFGFVFEIWAIMRKPKSDQ
ncbi:MAG: DUF3098 domain-containing protein [Marinilabiliales bacterium]|nr:MAG: DUF3098 domain-containing protein [Marinilabiliales bacterium]